MRTREIKLFRCLFRFLKLSDEEVKGIFRSLVFILLPGLGIFIFGIKLGEHRLSSLATNLGSVLMAIGSIDAVFNVVLYHNVNEKINSLSAGIVDLQNTVSIAKGAIESGITAVYANRQDALLEIDKKFKEIIANKVNILNQIQKQGKKEIELKLLGISLGDYLCPHGSLKETFKKLLKEEGIKITIMILKDNSETAIKRAKKEELYKFSSGNDAQDYLNTKCHNELKTATNVAEDYLYWKGKEETENSPNVKCNFEYYQYDYAPMAFILILNDEMFVENYHLGGRGGESPVLRITKYKKDSMTTITRLFDIYSKHFNNLLVTADSRNGEAIKNNINGDIETKTDSES